MNYGLEVMKLVEILKSPVIPEAQKLVAENRLRQIKDLVTASQYNLPKDRIGDVQELERVIKDPATSEFHRQKAKDAIKKIVSEGKDIREMRRSLIREAKAGRSENVRDITEYVQKHSKYQ